MIKLNNISKKYDNKLVFNKINLEFKINTINIVSGPSGCGKSTLFNILSGIDKSFDGLITGVPNNISYLFQEDRLLPYYNILDNVLFTLPDYLSENDKLEISKSNLNKMGLENELHVFPHELSGGMSRRASIARALSFPSELLLLDEPFNGLNIELKKVVIKAINDNMKDSTKTVIIVTHDTSILEEFESVNIVNIDNIVD